MSDIFAVGDMIRIRREHADEMNEYYGDIADELGMVESASTTYRGLSDVQILTIRLICGRSVDLYNWAVELAEGPDGR